MHIPPWLWFRSTKARIEAWASVSLPLALALVDPLDSRCGFHRCYDNHPADCPCAPCDVKETLTTGRMAFFIKDQTPREASKIKSRQGYLKANVEDRKPELGFGKDPDCSVCQGIPKNCMLDTLNWRLCPHAV